MYLVPAAGLEPCDPRLKRPLLYLLSYASIGYVNIIAVSIFGVTFLENIFCGRFVQHNLSISKSDTPPLQVGASFSKKELFLLPRGSTPTKLPR